MLYKNGQRWSNPRWNWILRVFRESRDDFFAHLGLAQCGCNVTNFPPEVTLRL